MNSFEERLARLELITEKMRDKNVPLEESMKLFDEGIALSEQLEKELESYERKVEKLVNLPPVDGSGETDFQDFSA